MRARAVSDHFGADIMGYSPPCRVGPENGEFDSRLESSQRP